MIIQPGSGPDIGTSYTENQMIEHGYDLEHEGWGGYRIDDIRNTIDSWFAASPPDIIMLMIGTNDINASIAVSTMVNRLNALVDEILAHPIVTPSTHLFLATVPPCQNDGLNNEALELNSYIPGIVSDRQGLGHPVHFVDAYSAVDRATDLADNLHPDSAGYAKIGMAFYHAILPVVTNGNASPELAAIGDRTFTEGISGRFAVEATDPDNDNITLTTSPLPPGAWFFDNGDGAGDFYWTPDYSRAGVYEITFYASDPFYSDSEEVTITVDDMTGNDVTIEGITSETEVFLYGTSGWIGEKKLEQSGTLSNVSPGCHVLVLTRPGKRTEYIPLYLSGNDTTVTITLKDRVSLGFGAKDTLIADGNPVSLGDYSAAVCDDIDRDGDIDLLAALTSGVVEYFESDGSDLFAGPAIVLDVPDIQSIRTADWDGDNRIDIISGAFDGTIRVHYNYGPMLFSPGELLADAGSGLTGFDITDLHGDGDPDFFCGYADGTVKSVTCNGSGWDTPVELQTQGGAALLCTDSVCPVVMEITGDSSPDLIVASESDTIFCCRQFSDGTFGSPEPVNAAGAALQMAGRGVISWIYGGYGEFPSLVIADVNGMVCTAKAMLRGDIDTSGTVESTDLSILGDSWDYSEHGNGWDEQKNSNLDLSPVREGEQGIDISDLNVLGDCYGNVK
ncbi:MAG: hypothetical protein GF350_04640 [Chitinivibrionales bacterium]|nr:hypothetical protein [Chitinivibrionales bacterium]